MLSHSPPLPLTVDYSDESGITAGDEEVILLALEHRHRIHYLCLVFSDMHRIVMAIDGEFPILEFLIVEFLATNSTAPVLPETLQAPHLRHLMLNGFAFPIRPRLRPTVTGLVTLCLVIQHETAYFQPNILLQWISFIPQLESLLFALAFPVFDHDVESHMPSDTTYITLPKLRVFEFYGVNAYLDAVVCRIKAPLLEKLYIKFSEHQLTFPFPVSRLPQFANTTENLRFGDAVVSFEDDQTDVLLLHPGANTYQIWVMIECCHLEQQVSAMAGICNGLCEVFSAVENLTLQREVHDPSSQDRNDVDRIEWRRLLRSFSNVKTLSIKDGLVEDLSHCLRPEDGELPLEILPELQVLKYSQQSRGTDYGGAFNSLIVARRNAGRHVLVGRHVHP